jgi:hypothetical protein
MSFITTMRLPMLQLSCRLFYQHPYSPDLAPCYIWLLPKLNSALKERRFLNSTVLLTFTSVNTTPAMSKIPLCTSTPHPTGRHRQLFPSSDWSEKEIVLLSLADQIKFLSHKLKFPWDRNAHNIAESL